MIIVDTTVLVYAVGGDHPLKQACLELLRLISSGDVRATTTPEVIQELAHVRARRQDREDAARVARAFGALFAPLLTVTAEDLDAGLGLFTRTRLGAFDAVLAAAALRSGCRLLVSADRAFAAVDGLSVGDPAKADFLARVRAVRR
jgi:predicted nucleic acid-binding protein